MSTIVSTFSAYYVHLWLDFFPDYKLSAPLPSFDGRAVLYPDLTSVRDYFSWRQVDCRCHLVPSDIKLHKPNLRPRLSELYFDKGSTRSNVISFTGHINNLYNTTFWHLVLKGDMSAIDAEARLSGTLSAEKNEILFSQFGVNYNREPEIYKKGSVIFRDLAAPTEKKKSKEGDLSARAMEPENVSSTEAAVGSSKTTSTDTETNVDDGQDTSALTPMTAPKSCPAPVKSESQIKESTKRLASSTPKPKSKTAQLKAKKLRQRAPVVVEHIDIIQDEFWKRRPWILSPDDFSLE